MVNGWISKDAKERNGMIQVERFQSTAALYERAIALIKQVKADGAKTFGLATGGTMEPLYARLRETDIDFSDAISFNLDEYVGLSATHPESYHYYMHEQLFAAKPFAASYLPDGSAADATAEAARYEALLARHPLDFQLLGIGVNGHIGFNEPGTPFDSTTHVVTLAESTRKANARYFETIDDVPTEALTMGISSIMRATCILLIATGESKRAVLNQVLEGMYTEDVPATVLTKHPQVIVLTDLQP